MTTTRPTLDPDATREFVDRQWDQSIVPQLIDYIRIPNKSPHFDPDWAQHGHMQKAVELIAAWCRKRKIEGLSLEVCQLEGRTPLVFMEIPAFGVDASAEQTVVLYGHLDKQPEMRGWREGLGPWEPVLEGDRLYGRGGADDGYSAFASLTAIEALQRQGVPHNRCVVIIEACEESGSYDLPYHIAELAPRIGTADLVVCLDSGCGNYEQLWLTNSLRGNLTATLRVELLREGVHSGDSSGVVAESFRVLRQLLARVEDQESGAILIDALNVEIPQSRRAQAETAAEVLGDSVHSKFPWHAGVRPVDSDLVELILNRAWRPTLCVTGASGLPDLADAGNVMRPETAVKLSLRLPPTLPPAQAENALREALSTAPPYGAKVTLEEMDAATGWNAPDLAPWLENAVDRASQTYFGKGLVQLGEGGTIPFMGMLGDRFPRAQFLITGVLGPGSNAHGPNEFLHIPMGKRLTACVAQVIADHHAHCFES